MEVVLYIPWPLRQVFSEMSMAGVLPACLFGHHRQGGAGECNVTAWFWSVLLNESQNMLIQVITRVFQE